MADFLRYGIKEVADVRFYPVGGVSVDENTGAILSSASPALVLDTLKVSTIEFTAEQAEARGGKGNAPLIIWDYGREINVTLEDALMSSEMFHLMFGSTGTGNCVTVSAKTYPGTYAVVGKTYARDTDGKDHMFTFYIPKAKIQSENTITMEAEGDPTVFNMSLRVLRGDENGAMIKLILDVENDASEIDWNGPAANTLVATFICEEGTASIYVESGSVPTAPFDGYTWSPDADKPMTKNTTYSGTKAEAAGE